MDDYSEEKKENKKEIEKNITKPPKKNYRKYRESNIEICQN